MKGRQVHSQEFKQTAVRRMLSGENVTELARELGVGRQRLYEWRERARLNGVESLRGPGRAPRSEGRVLTPLRGGLPGKGELSQRRIAELERKVAQQELDLDFFRQALRHVKTRRQAAAGRGELRSMKSSKR
jgi:transposase-like protein